MENYNIKKLYHNVTYYYFNNKLHRTDGPAIEYDNGEKRWYIDGKLHRLDGPAVEFSDGNKEWWINGKSLQELSRKQYIDKQFMFMLNITLTQEVSLVKNNGIVIIKFNNLAVGVWAPIFGLNLNNKYEIAKQEKEKLCMECMKCYSNNV